MKSRRVIGLDGDWAKLAQLQEILVLNEARMARLVRQLEEMAILLENPSPAGQDFKAAAEPKIAAEGG